MIELVSVILPGIGEMANIHPLLVHFPIALLNSFLIMELLGIYLKKKELRCAATWMLYLGTLSAAAAVITGLAAAHSVPHGEELHSIILRHRNFGFTVLCLSLILSIFRFIGIDKTRTVQLFIGIITVGIMTFGADLGGLMVYKYGVAVKAVPQPAGHDHSSGDDHSMGGDKANDMDMKEMTLEERESAKDGYHSMPHKH